MRPVWPRTTLCWSDQDDGSLAEIAGLDERGVHHRNYVGVGEPTDAAVVELADELRERRSRAQRLVFDAYAEGPSFWLGLTPDLAATNDAGSAVARAAAPPASFALTRNGAQFAWDQRQLVFQARASPS